MADRPLPTPNPETQHFWDGLRAGELRLQRCHTCGHAYFPPQPFCPDCLSRDVDVFASTGRGSLHSYVISHRAVPGFDVPYAIAVVELDEGPRLMTNIVDCEQTPEALVIDMPVELAPTAFAGDVVLPLFRPASRPLEGAEVGA